MSDIQDDFNLEALKAKIIDGVKEKAQAALKQKIYAYYNYENILEFISNAPTAVDLIKVYYIDDGSPYGAFQIETNMDMFEKLSDYQKEKHSLNMQNVRKKLAL